RELQVSVTYVFRGPSAGWLGHGIVCLGIRFHQTAPSAAPSDAEVEALIERSERIGPEADWDLEIINSMAAALRSLLAERYRQVALEKSNVYDLADMAWDWLRARYPPTVGDNAIALYMARFALGLLGGEQGKPK